VPVGGAPVTPTGRARVLACANQKGGTGKTTTAVALAAVLAQDTPVLAIDCDAQGNLTQSFGLDPDRQEKTLYNVFVEDMPLSEAMLAAGPPSHFLSLVPANLLKNAIETISDRFSYIVLDCPPNLELTTINALVAATEVIVPVDMSVFSVRGMLKLEQTMRQVRKVNTQLAAPRIVATKTSNTTISSDVEQRLRSSFSGSMFQTAIPTSKDVPESHAATRALPYYAPDSKASLAYEALAQEIRNEK
jgi:chromosome partitioning protein